MHLKTGGGGGGTVPPPPTHTLLPIPGLGPDMPQTCYQGSGSHLLLFQHMTYSTKNDGKLSTRPSKQY